MVDYNILKFSESFW